MKKLLLMVLLGLCLLSTTAFPQLLFTEDFTGLTPGTLAGQSSWTKAGTGPDLSIANTTPLTYSGYNGGGGEYAVMPTGTSTTSRIFKTFSPTGVVATGNVYYFSFLLNLTATSAMGASTSNYCLTLGDAAGSSSNLTPKLYARTSGAGFNIGISKQTTTNTAITWGASVLNLNETYLIVEKYVFNTLGAGHDDGVYLWVDPTGSSEPVMGSAECQNDGTTNTVDLDFDNYQTPAGGVGSVIWNNRGTGNPVGAFDGIRLAYGTTSALAWGYLNLGTPLPVELSSFTSIIKGSSVILKWATATEVQNHGFDIERSINNSVWTKLGFVSGNGNSNSLKNYSFTDNSLAKSGKYYYRLKQLDNDGASKYSNIIEADFVKSSAFSMDQNYPNPFNPTTVISYSLPQASNVKLLVYNAIGQIVRVLENGFKNAGNYSVSFNASEMPSGLYFYKIEAGQFSQMRKMLLVK